MNEKGIGQYDLEYSVCKCFWGTNPGKYVNLLCDHIHKGSVLDLGAGEGKNSIYLAQRGFNVTAVECSTYAIDNFNIQLSNLDAEVRSRIKIIQADVLKYFPGKCFDVIIAYGLLHCMPSIEKLDSLIQFMKSHTERNGFNVIVTFTNKYDVPEVQDYLEPTLIKEDHLSLMYSDWKIIQFENDVIEESHPTTNIIHKHSLCRLLSQRI